jgi:hypothetical protein
MCSKKDKFTAVPDKITEAGSDTRVSGGII